ncbi:MAG: GPW/gp25 family protein [Bacillota bacterium]|nr:GPW/gp25 family protein [Bacillota bacterium]
MEVIDFLGKGWKMPISVYKEKAQTSEGKDSIKESILLILSTGKGERVMRPEFGCRLKEMVYASNNISTATLIKSHIEEALLTWEPRIEVLDITANPRQNEPVMDISIEYLIKTSNSKDNLVYPFYLESVGK